MPRATSSYTLYGSRGSGSASIEAALILCNAKWKRVDAASWTPGPGFEELKKHNPLGLVPTLVLPDGSVMTESAAILIHLAEAFPQSGLLPAEPSPRAQALRGLVYLVAQCYAAIGIIDYPERWCADCDKATAERIRAGSRARLHHYWDLFADQFPGFGRSGVGALELLAATVSRWSGARAHLAQARPALHAALLKVESDPRIAEVFARHWPPAA